MGFCHTLMKMTEIQYKSYVFNLFYSALYAQFWGGRWDGGKRHRSRVKVVARGFQVAMAQLCGGCCGGDVRCVSGGGGDAT